MGRPWWYDSYYEKKEKRPGFRLPHRRFWARVALVIVSLFLAIAGTGFRLDALAWGLGFVRYFCNILAACIFIRSLLSWFRVGYRSWPLMVLGDLTEPVIAPLRRIIPVMGGLDFSPLVAIMVLYFVPSIVRWLVSLFL